MIDAKWARAFDSPLIIQRMGEVSDNTTAIYYRSESRNRMVAEILRFDAARRVTSAAGLYAAAPGSP
ncbi:MAG TPA: hypothetical protein VMF03_20030 [Steroidobacteraceae bacterium]|nr:hypothetical protein [Steroidobacteraceae bacterium]